jgi:hypothetical protein
MDLHGERAIAQAWMAERELPSAIVIEVLEWVADRLTKLERTAINFDELAGVIKATWTVESLAHGAAIWADERCDHQCATCDCMAEPGQRQCINCQLVRRPLPS